MTKEDLHADVFSFWNLADKTVTDWHLNGTVLPGLPRYPYMPPNPPTTVVPGSMLAGITLQAGNAIMPAAADCADRHHVDRGFLHPNRRSCRREPNHLQRDRQSGRHRRECRPVRSVYVNVDNSNDCGWIGDDVAAAAGATMPSLDWSIDPSANVSGGFWRVVYRGQIRPIQFRTGPRW